jgi:hypothetical protein
MTVLWRIGATLTRKAAAVSRSVGTTRYYTSIGAAQITNEILSL